MDKIQKLIHAVDAARDGVEVTIEADDFYGTAELLIERAGVDGCKFTELVTNKKVYIENGGTIQLIRHRKKMHVHV